MLRVADKGQGTGQYLAKGHCLFLRSLFLFMFLFLLAQLVSARSVGEKSWRRCTDVAVPREGVVRQRM